MCLPHWFCHYLYPMFPLLDPRTAKQVIFLAGSFRTLCCLIYIFTCEIEITFCASQNTRSWTSIKRNHLHLGLYKTEITIVKCCHMQPSLPVRAAYVSWHGFRSHTQVSMAWGPPQILPAPTYFFSTLSTTLWPMSWAILMSRPCDYVYHWGLSSPSQSLFPLNLPAVWLDGEMMHACSKARKELPMPKAENT